jgi:hypothetical protein
LVAVSLVALIGVAGLVVDAGRMMVSRRHAQYMADAAAEAGAISLYLDKSVSVAQQQARQYAGDNRYLVGDLDDGTLVVNIPPTSGAFKDNANYVEVLCTEKLNTLFMRALRWSADPTWVRVQARAVAGFASKGVPDGLVVLDPTGSMALDAIRLRLRVVNAGIQVNSRNKSSAAAASRGAQVSAESIRIVGGFRESSGAKFVATPSTGVSPAQDPLSAVPAPTQSGLTERGRIEVTSATDWIRRTGSRTVTLEPGVYTGGIRIDANLDVVMRPGIYYINGGGFELHTNGTVTGDHCCVYNGGSYNCGNTYGAIRIEAYNNFRFTPPSDGNYKGMSFFQDRDNFEPGLIDVVSGKTVTSGAIYMASAQLDLEADGTMTGTLLVLHRFRALGTGSGTFTFDQEGTPKAVDIALVE